MTDTGASHAQPGRKNDEATATHAGASPQRLPSETLLRGQRVVEIAHNGEVYRLQTTRLGKLILTK